MAYIILDLAIGIGDFSAKLVNVYVVSLYSSRRNASGLVWHCTWYGRRNVYDTSCVCRYYLAVMCLNWRYMKIDLMQTTAEIINSLSQVHWSAHSQTHRSEQERHITSAPWQSHRHIARLDSTEWDDRKQRGPKKAAPPLLRPLPPNVIEAHNNMEMVVWRNGFLRECVCVWQLFSCFRGRHSLGLFGEAEMLLIKPHTHTHTHRSPETRCRWFSLLRLLQTNCIINIWHWLNEQLMDTRPIYQRKCFYSQIWWALVCARARAFVLV